MSLSRRQFFGRLREVAEGPDRWRERRIAELREYALKKMPAEWTPQQRDTARWAVEHRVVYLSEESLRTPEMYKYVDAILSSKDLFFETTEVSETTEVFEATDAFEATETEQDQYHHEDPYYEDYSG